MDASELRAALDVAVAAALEAQAGVLASFRDARLAVDTKGDGTIVTAADREAEATIRRALRASQRFGAIAIVGEEQGLDEGAGGNDLRWVIDPIDGTLAFARGNPLFGTLIALEERETGRALVGVVHLPALGETYRAARGLGAWCGDERLRASSCERLADATASIESLATFRRNGRVDAHQALVGACGRTTGNNDCFGHALVARGALDMSLELGLAVWDLRASQVLVEEAGGATRVLPAGREGRWDFLIGAPRLVEAAAELIYARK